MKSDLNLKQTQNEWHGTWKAYVNGFLLSLILTIASFGLVLTKALQGASLVYTLAALALVQAIVQILFFLHLGKEAKPRWETVVFYFMLLVLLIIVGGTLWIMHDLNQRVMEHMLHD